MKNVFLVIVLFVLGASCNGGGAPANEEILTNVSDPQTTGQELNYEEDWNRFKAAARIDNQGDLAELCTENVADFEGLRFLLSELYVQKALDQKSYSELVTEELDGKSYLIFYAEEIYFEEGYEYGTSLTLQFLKTNTGLRLDQYFAAG